jgi:carboxypeptidase Q
MLHLRLPGMAAAATAVTICLASQPTAAQRATADPVVTRIQEAADAAELTETVFHLTDAIGPRVVGSPALLDAERRLAQRLRDYGLRNVRVEKNPPVNVGGGLVLDPPGWSWSRLTVQQLAPWPQTLIAMPVLYSPATSGTQGGEAVVAPLPRPVAAEVESFIQQHRGALRGKFLLTSAREATVVPAATRVHRYSADELRDLQTAVEPPAVTPAAPRPETTPPQPQAQPPSVAEVFEQYSRVFDFLRSEGALGLLGPARRGSEGGTLFVNGPPAPPQLAAAPLPMADLAPEHFNRLLRLVQRKVPVRLEMNLESSFHSHVGTENVLAEIQGSDRPDEVVLVGAHLDSWHAATGATDNAIGVAIVLEAVRILTTLRVPLRRSVHVAFWGGEEVFNLAGSRGYVQRYLFDRNGQPNDAHRKLSAYLNVDYGSGRIRGIYLQGNEKLEPLFDTWLADVADGTLVATRRTTLGSDQAAFERIGIPGLSFIQDPLNYEQRTHHTNMDEPDYIVLDDARQSAATLATVIYKIANADALLPRKDLR